MPYPSAPRARRPRPRARPAHPRVGDDGLPCLLVKPFDKFDYATAMPVARGEIDHCFVGWDRMAEITWPDRPYADLQITASDALTCAVVCVRSDLDCFCFEPVAHSNDALNRRIRTTNM